MQISIKMRNYMLEQVKAALMDVSASQTIKFYDSGSNLLCTIEFKDIEVASVANRAVYKFQAPDSTYVLRGTSVGSGTVSYFEIDGLVPGATLDPKMIKGSVGSFSSNADMKINRIDWTSNTVITLSNVSIVMLQGL